jgi:Rieske Fe-S protein
VADPVSRRALLSAAAAGVGAAACGAPPPGAAPATAPAPTTDPGRYVGLTSEVPVGGGHVFREARVVVTQPVPGEFRGFGIVCTHDSCELNAVANGTINCPCHGSRFAITDGSVVRGPALTGLRVERIAVDGGRIVVRRIAPGGPPVAPTG